MGWDAAVRPWVRAKTSIFLPFLALLAGAGWCGLLRAKEPGQDSKYRAQGSSFGEVGPAHQYGYHNEWGGSALVGAAMGTLSWDTEPIPSTTFP